MPAGYELDYWVIVHTLRLHCAPTRLKPVKAR